MYSYIFYAEIMQVLCSINSKKQWLILLQVVMGFGLPKSWRQKIQEG